MDDLTRLRIDQVGSLVAPPDLRADPDAAIRAAILRQEAIGLPVVSDGELRRQNFQDSFAATVSGFDVPNAPLTAAAKESWKFWRRSSPSLTTGSPMASCR